MKTYEEMARDVLRRRDEELLSMQQTSQLNAPPEVVYPGAAKKRSRIQKISMIAIPCAAAVLVGTVGVTVWKNVRGNQNPNHTPGIAAEEGDLSDTSKLQYIFQEFADRPTHIAEERENIYKGGKTEININEAEFWNVYHLPLLSAEDRVPIADDEINNYYGMEFDRLTRVFPEWNAEHEEFCRYEHDEDDGVVASHTIINSTNAISYAINYEDWICVEASITPTFESATVENAKPSVINGFDAMVYSLIGENDAPLFAADIKMGFTTVQIHTGGVSREEFLNILDVYTAPDKNDDNNQNHNQTMEDKIVIYNGLPDFIGGVPPYEPVYTDYSDTEGVTWLRYSEEELNALYGLNFMCFSELHPDWKKFYDELSFGVYYNVDDHAIGGDIPQNREIVGTRNYVTYSTSEGHAVTIIASKRELPETDIEHSVVNGYDAILFLGFEDGKYKYYSAFIDMDDTLLCVTVSGFLSENDFLDIIREYTSEASKYDKSANPPEPSEFESFSAVDFVDDRITYDVSWDAQSSWWKLNYSEDFDAAETYGKIEYSDTTLVYLRDFFGTNKLPVDYRYQNNFEREMYNGTFSCNTAEGAMAYSPVDGKVVGACEGWYNRGLGNAVAVEFGDGKIFIIGHLDEVNVEVGDTVAAGQILGVCGQSGAVYFGDPPKLSLIMMVKTDD